MCVASNQLLARLAFGVDRDHRHLHADFPTADRPFPNRSAVLRHHGCAQLADGILVAAGGDGRLLLKGGRATARNAESNFCRHDAVYGHPSLRDVPALHVAGNRAVAARSTV